MTRLLRAIGLTLAILALPLPSALAQVSPAYTLPTPGTSSQAVPSLFLVPKSDGSNTGVPPSASDPLVVNGTLGVSTQAYTATASLTINAASAHLANDVVGASAAALTFANLCPAAGREVIFTSTRLRYDIAAIPSGMTSFRLYLYNVTPPSALADDAPFDLPSGDRASFLGYVDLGSPVDLGSTLYVETNGNQKQVTCASTSVFGYLVTNGAYTTGTDVVTLVVKVVAP